MGEVVTVRILIGDVRAPDGRFIKGVHAWRKPKPHWERNWLLREYVEKQRSTADIAAECGCGENNIQFWLKKHGIAARSPAEVRAVKYWGASGPANPMFGKRGIECPRYVDGSAPERQRMYARAEGKQFLRRIYERDQYRCRRCSAPKAGKRSLHVHHIRPWAGNPELRFDEANVVTLCLSCHRWVHSLKNEKREYLA